ncbi:CBS domain-containing protein [Antrihabitans sp. YC2-6]|uniref:CBS domain-containing protein n=1 Tax=Antrihabitans sp. YC2-6 TaxID=2799498 RepID=UPI0018F2A2D2|nr:CBS domain-containing protein [Antrihabitans sp. YC2-6]MBJ8347004.1 CBS domain-containing protein [Antrihabitans sp. YC2-6]
MKSKTVADLMTTDVVNVREYTAFKDVVFALRSRDVSGMPVVDGAGHVVGVITEADLLPKEAAGGSQSRAANTWHRRRRAGFRRKAAAQTARDAMSTPPITIGPAATAAKAAAILASQGIKRLPVVDADHKLIGVISRKDIVATFARTDAEIRQDVERDVLRRGMWLLPSEIGVEVHDGVVTLSGQAERVAMIGIMTALTTAIPGVVGVVNRVTAEMQDNERR